MASDSSDAALHGKVRLLCPDGWSADPAELTFVLPPGEHLETDAVLTMAAGGRAGAVSGARRTGRDGQRRGVDAARLAPGGRGRVRGVGRPHLPTTTCCG